MYCCAASPTVSGAGLANGRGIIVTAPRPVKNIFPASHCFKSMSSRLILSSTSPYRRQLLQRLPVPFEVVASKADETPRPGERPLDLAVRLAQAKAQAVATSHPDAWVIGSDQLAVCRGQILGKPGTA